MPMIEQFTFYDSDENDYEFEVYPVGTTFKPNAGVYMFTKRWIDRQGVIWHKPLYCTAIGNSDHPLNQDRATIQSH